MKLKLANVLTPWNLLTGLTLFLAFFLRIYRVNEILGFYYDQGRDALIIWDLWHKAKFFLIGPTTGIAGIFRGPFYYYLIAPLYLVGEGNPIYPAIFLAGLSVFAIWILYHISLKYIGRETALFVSLLGSFSFFIIMASRWLSNPTPMLLSSAILFWMMILVTKGRKWAWVAISFIVGLSVFHFGSAGEIFYIPALFVFAIWQRENLPNLKLFFLSLLVFILTIAPQFVFDIRHEGILRNNISNFVVEEKSFGLPNRESVKNRVNLYGNIFANELFNAKGSQEKAAYLILALSLLVFLPELIKKDIVKILCLLIGSVAIGLMFFRGNDGVVYDYYLTGYYLFALTLTAIILSRLWTFKLGKLFVIYFFYLFLINNLGVTWYKLSDKGESQNSITYLNQKKAIDWVYQDAKEKEFNVDFYVPPVIPYSYDYLFLWYGGEIHGRKPQKENVSLLYTISEVDPSHPERLEAWQLRQKGIGKIENSTQFGGITVERRRRLKY